MFDIYETLVGIFLFIDALLLKFVSWIYGVYIQIANMRILSEEMYISIRDRIYVVVGVLALFMVAYTLLQNIIDPENKKSDNGFSIVKKIIFAFIAVTLIPTAFDFMYGLQASVLSNSVIERIFLSDDGSVSIGGDKTTFDFSEDDSQYVLYYLSYDPSTNAPDYYYLTENCNLNYLYTCELTTTTSNALTVDSAIENQNFDVDYFEQQQVGNYITYELMSAFLSPVYEEEIVPENGWWANLWEGSTSGLVLSDDVGSWSNTSNYIIATGEFDKITPFADSVVDGEMNYTYIISGICIIIFGFCLIGFTIDVATRLIKLTVYQIIAPIPMFLSILPKNDDLLKNWFKQVATCYVEVFIRVASLAGGIFLITLIL